MMADGTIVGPFACTEGSSERQVSLTGTWTYVHDANGHYTDATLSGEPYRIYYGTGRDRTKFGFGETSDWSQECRVILVQPTGQFHVKITMLTEDNRVHTT